MRKYKVNEDYFKEIDSHKKAYWIGWIITDCSISNASKKTKSMRLAMNLSQEDDVIVKDFLKDIESTHKIRYYQYKDGYKKVGVNVNSNQFVDNLLKHNVKKCGELARVPKIPNEFMASFLLGVFDGDGHVSYRVDKNGRQRYCFEIVNQSKELIYFLQDLLLKNNMDFKVYERETKNGTMTYRLMTSKQINFRLVYDYMYQNDFGLQRKKNIFETIIKTLDI